MQHTLPPFQAIILDMDGLVLDTEPTYRMAWQTAAADLGLPISDEFRDSVSGYSYDRVERELIACFGTALPLSRFRELGTKHWWRHVEKYGINTKPGYNALVKRLRSKKIPFCLATNSQQKNAEDCLALAGIREDFDTLVTRDQVADGKPAPDLYLEAAKALQLLPKQCLAVEDSVAGMQSAVRAGAITITIPDRCTPADDCRKFSICVLGSLTELASLL